MERLGAEVDEFDVDPTWARSWPTVSKRHATNVDVDIDIDIPLDHPGSPGRSENGRDVNIIDDHQKV